MYFYRLGYYSHEDSSDTTLIHDKQFSEKEVGEMIATAFVNEAIKSAKEMFDDLPDETIQDAKDGRHVPYETYSDSSTKVIDYLINHFGFRRPQYEVEHFVDGWKGLLVTRYEEGITEKEAVLTEKLKQAWEKEFGWLPKNED